MKTLVLVASVLFIQQIIAQRIVTSYANAEYQKSRPADDGGGPIKPPGGRGGRQ